MSLISLLLKLLISLGFSYLFIQSLEKGNKYGQFVFFVGAVIYIVDAMLYAEGLK